MNKMNKTNRQMNKQIEDIKAYEKKAKSILLQVDPRAETQTLSLREGKTLTTLFTGTDLREAYGRSLAFLSDLGQNDLVVWLGNRRTTRIIPIAQVRRFAGLAD